MSKTIDCHVRSKANPQHGGGIGDAIQMLAVIKAVALANPDAHVRAVCVAYQEPWIRLGWPHVVTVESKEPLSDIQLWPQEYESLGGDRIAIQRGQTRQEMWGSALGLKPALEVTPIIPDAAREWAVDMHAKISGDGKRRVIWLCPFSAATSRTWPLKRWCELAHLLKDEYALAGMFCERDHGIEKVNQFFFPMWQVQDVPADKTAALFSLASMVIGNDSGLTHLAGFLGVPAIAICGPTVGPCVFGCYPSVRTIARDTVTWFNTKDAGQKCAGCLGEQPWFQPSCYLECEMLHKIQAWEVANLAERMLAAK